MCRYNLIMVKDKSAEDLLKHEDYQILYDDLLGYSAFQKGYCNCNSFVGSLCGKKELGYYNAIETTKKEKLERLYQIKKLMNQQDYEIKREQFKQQQMKLLHDMNILTEHISDFEREQTKEIRNNNSGEILNEKLNELYRKLEKMHKELESQPDYKYMHEAYVNFIKENELLNESIRYYLSREEVERVRSQVIPLSELLNFDEDPNEIEGIQVEIELPVIDEVIAREENNTFADNQEEFNDLQQLFYKLSEQVQSFMFATIWSEPDNLKMSGTVNIDSFKIDDLAFLEYNEMICITK